jgi:hypothetical protein
MVTFILKLAGVWFLASVVFALFFGRLCAMSDCPKPDKR